MTNGLRPQGAKNNQPQLSSNPAPRLSESALRFNELLRWLCRNRLNLPHKIVVIVPGHTDRTLRDHGIDFLVRFSNGVRLGFKLLETIKGMRRRSRSPEQPLEGIKIVNIKFGFEEAQQKLSHAASYVVKMIMKPLTACGRKLSRSMRRAQRLLDESRRQSCPRNAAFIGAH